jgi:chromosome segregation ATPase
MNRPQLLPESPDDKDTAKFLRRFSELISVGQSASYLRHAAGLIEELVGRVRQGEELLRQQQAITDNHLASRRAAELELQSARAELFEFKAARSVEALKLTLATNSVAEEKQTLSNRCAHAEARLAEASEDLRKLQSRYEGLGDTHQLVPVSTLLLLRAQFGSLAKEFKRKGDTVSDVMCEIGVHTIDQAIAGEAG